MTVCARSHLVAGLMVAALLVTIEKGQADDRTWTDDTGKFSVKAEFVAIKQGKVQLKRADNGQLIEVPLDRLSQADRELATKLATSAKENTDQAAGELKVTGALRWSKFPSFDENGKEAPRDLELVVTAKGKQAVEAIRYGFLKLDSVTTAQGTKLARKKEDFDFEDLGKKYTTVDRTKNMFVEQPKDGLTVAITLDRGKDRIARIAEAKGSFKIRTGGKRKVLKIENAPSLHDKDLDNAEFKAAQIKAKVEAADKNLILHLEGEHGSIYRVEAKTPSGGELKGQSGSGSGGGGRFKQFSFFFFDSIPKNATLFVHMASDTVEVEVPFELKNLKVPPEPKGFGR